MSPISSPPATRRSERKRTANTRAADLSSPIPHRAKPTRKRKASTTLPPRRRPRQKSPEEDAADTEEEDQSVGSASDDNEDNKDIVDVLLPYLTVSDNNVAVAQEYSNQLNAQKYGDRNINAYAKICGSDWTYYVLETQIFFGRSPDPQQARQSTGPGAEPTQENAEDSTPIAIDLGPSKVVSRTHGELKYSHMDDAWHVHCYGRNGVKVNDKSLKRGESTTVNSGTVIAIAGTEMLFIAAKGKTELHQMFIDRILAHQNNEGVDEELGSRHQQHAADGPQPAPENGLHTHPDYPASDPYYDGRPAIAPTPANMPRPVTPDPSPARRMNTASAKKRSPGYKRGIMLESTEQIDYSLDSAKDLKPGCSYAALITWAILSTPEEALSLNGIYTWIKAHYSYYREVHSGWQNSIRHNLSLNPSFEKIARRADEPGKGMKWRLVPEQRQATIAMANKNASKGGGRISSAPGSPAGHAASSGFLSTAANGNMKGSPDARTPPLSSYPPTQQPSFTPTRGPQLHLPAYAPTQGTHPVLSDETSPLPRRRTNGHLAAVDSSPTLTSGAWPNDPQIQTPAPRPYNLTAPQPNTVKLPTSHMADSSPAPFWTFPGSVINSTPAGWPTISPLKNVDANGDALDVQSSSPPPATNGADSPTRRSGPKASFASSQSGNANGLGPGEDEDGGIDITKGFTNISSYHRQRSHVASNGINS